MVTTTTAVPAIAPEQVPARRGVDWWSSALRWMFAPGQAGVWIGIGFASIVLSMVAGALPAVGSVASPLLCFLLAAGVAVAAQKSARGVVPPFSDLFAGFGGAAGPLVAAGLLIAIASAAVGMLLLAAGLGGMLSAVFGGIMAGLGGMGGLDGIGGFAGAAAGFGLLASLLMFIAGLLVFVPISMAAWLAPALIVLRGATPVDALKASLRAAWRNAGALTVYGLVFVVLAVAASLLLGLGWLVLAPLVGLSTYAAYADLFGTPA